ncbi:MAG: hypothetical protein IT376_19590 [Polyangiaceae bacterium]|nr:hypothetical protein [Polyangiaceae bacterium]
MTATWAPAPRAARLGARAAVLGVSLALARPSSAGQDAAAAPAASATRLPLPPLPRPAPLAPPESTPATLAEVDRLLERVSGPDAATREEAARELREAPPAWVGAIRKRVDDLAGSADRGAMRALLERARKKALAQLRARAKAAGEKAPAAPEWMAMLVEHAEPEKPAYVALARLVALTRMLVAIDTVEAARELVEVHVRFGELMRVDVQVQLEKMGDRSLAALLEARRHRAEKIGRWADRQLDARGKSVPGETVRVEDPRALADVLRAWGRVRDPLAARIVISFASSERAQVREAAREGVALLGEAGVHALRDAYEDTVGRRAPREWTWERIARELFAELDRMRLAEPYARFEAAQAALEARDWVAARQALDAVLAHGPNFGQRATLAAAYTSIAVAFFDSDPAAALDAAGRAERLAEDETLRAKAASLRLTLEATALLANGVADATLVERALELDPANERARALRDRAQRGELDRGPERRRYWAASAIALVAVLAIGFVALGRRRGAAERPAPAADPPSGGDGG